MSLEDPTFPPLLTGVPVAPGKDAFEIACKSAAGGKAGAGDLFWSRDTSRCSAAVVLEPEVAAVHALQMHYTSMVAFGDAFGALSPAEIGVFYRWPGGYIVNAARVGGARVALPRAAESASVPDWLVVSVDVDIGSKDVSAAPGHDLENTTLAEEGCGDLDRTQLIEAYGRHLLVWIDTWQQEGFQPVHEAWLHRAEAQGGAKPVRIDGVAGKVAMLGIDDEGNLLVNGDDGVARALPLLEHARRVG